MFLSLSSNRQSVHLSDIHDLSIISSLFNISLKIAKFQCTGSRIQVEEYTASWEEELLVEQIIRTFLNSSSKSKNFSITFHRK